MEIWHVWIICAIILMIIEIFTGGFALFCFSIGAVGGGIVAGCGGTVVWQFTAFAVISLICFIIIRPLIIKYLYKQGKHKTIDTNADGMIGKKGLVTEKITDINNPGRVKIDGDYWQAVSFEDKSIAKGASVIVKKLDSIILTVEELNK
ncbi:MAG: NfeD family protein [Bacteroidales bacterium]